MVARTAIYGATSLFIMAPAKVGSPPPKPDGAEVIRAEAAFSPIGRPMPPLLIQGEEDRVTPAASNAELLARVVPDATLVMLPGCGHLPEAEAPARVNELIEQHLYAGSKA
jgi:pimeloyl-ACP methyl ester carboxylesterase